MNAQPLESVYSIVEWILLPQRGIAKAWKVTKEHAPDEIWHMGLLGLVFILLWYIMQSESGNFFLLRGDLVPIVWQLVLLVIITISTLFQAYLLAVGVGLLLLFVLTKTFGLQKTEAIVNYLLSWEKDTSS